MSYDDILVIVRREAHGGPLSARESTQISDYIAAHPEKRSDIEFERALAATIIEQPVDNPSLDFVDNLLAKLPVAPIHVPVPSLRNAWQWVVGGVGAGAASSMAAWHWRDVLLGLLGDAAPALAPEPGSIMVGFYSFLGALGQQAPNLMTPSVIMGAMIALGAFAWGAISFADERH